MRLLKYPAIVDKDRVQVNLMNCRHPVDAVAFECAGDRRIGLVCEQGFHFG